ncbi:T-related protein [Halotydeus destructor]|nr:T-related protein [Halotydeus destructor]
MADMEEIIQLLDHSNMCLRKGQPYGAFADHPNLDIALQDEELWRKFNAATNEMIVTKAGRRMFPVINLELSGLKKNCLYTMVIEFVQVDSIRWKYMNGDWVSGAKSELPPPTRSRIYTHPESPNYGYHWLDKAVSFTKVKLTNKPNPSNGQVTLNSLHKYEPRIHIIKLGDEKQIYTFPLPETRFIAVTAYQNEDVTQLKIRFNPFAKAFQDARERPNDIQVSSSASDHYGQVQNASHVSPNSVQPNVHNLSPLQVTCNAGQTPSPVSYPEIPVSGVESPLLPFRQYPNYYTSSEMAAMTPGDAMAVNGNHHYHYGPAHRPSLVARPTYNSRSHRYVPYQHGGHVASSANESAAVQLQTNNQQLQQLHLNTTPIQTLDSPYSYDTSSATNATAPYHDEYAHL